MISSQEVLSDFFWGIERETHRIRSDGTISTLEHPETLKSPSFTKDFAESQLELVTHPNRSISGVLKELAALTKTAHQEIGSELFWPFSMPPSMGDERTIVTARKGADSAGRLAERYRTGLIHRYGAARQMICGLHVNVSFGQTLLSYLQRTAPLSSEEMEKHSSNDGYYLRLARNLIDDMPLLVKLFGASPVKDSPGDDPAFSYRNSPHGYARTEYRPFFALSSIEEYVSGIRRGMRTESDQFRRMGLIQNGKTIQLNDRVFQREKEFYAPIKFRRTAESGISSFDAIAQSGIEYLELRFYDIDPYTPFGISKEALNLTHLFILDGLTRVSSSKTNAELVDTLERADKSALKNPLTTAVDGFDTFVRTRLGAITAFAKILGLEYEQTLKTYARQFARPGCSPAARLTKDFRSSGLSWTQYGTTIAKRYRKGVLDEGKQ